MTADSTGGDDGRAARPAVVGARPGGPEGALAEGRRSERAEFWDRSRRGWDLAFYVLIPIAAAAVAVDERSGPRLWAVLGLLALLVAAYAGVGRVAAARGDRRRAAAYVVLLVAITSVSVYLNATATTLLFVAYSQIWYFSESRRAGTVASAVLTVGVFGGLLVRAGDDLGAVAEIATQGGIALVFSVVLGLWITTVAERGEERAELLDRLEAAQAELAASHHAEGVTAERERMAREIHDTLAQGFTSVVMLAQAARLDVGRGDGDAAVARLELVERTARENLAEARALVAAFAPVGLEGSTLVEALERLAARFEAETGVPVGVVLPDGGFAVDRPREVVLLRAAQEALTNVRRHAGARAVQLVLASEDTADGGATVHLEVTDDGRGFEPAAVPGERFGLRGMRERVSSGGGTLAVVSAPGSGTRVRVSLPVGGAGSEGFADDGGRGAAAGVGAGDGTAVRDEAPADVEARQEEAR